MAKLSRDEDCRRAVAEARERRGRVDGLVNNVAADDRAGPEAFRASLDAKLLHSRTPLHLLVQDPDGDAVAVVKVSRRR